MTIKKEEETKERRRYNVELIVITIMKIIAEVEDRKEKIELIWTP